MYQCSFTNFFFFFHFIGRANSTTEGGNAGGSVAATQTIMTNNDNQMAAFGPVTPEQEAAKSQVCVTYLLSSSISCFEILISHNFHYIKNENYEWVSFTKI